MRSAKYNPATRTTGAIESRGRYIMTLNRKIWESDVKKMASACWLARSFIYKSPDLSVLDIVHYPVASSSIGLKPRNMARNDLGIVDRVSPVEMANVLTRLT
jgi:hypothetical protein